MLKHNYFFILITLLLTFPLFLTAGESAKISRIQNNICPFECCQYGLWRAQSPLKVYAEEGNTSKIAFTIEPTKTFQAITGNIHIKQLGIVQVNKKYETSDLLSPTFKTVSFKPGDTFYILNYNGEGYFTISFKNKKYMIENYSWVVSSEANLTQELRTSWWVSIKYKEKKGWLNMEAKNEILGSDACE